MDWSNLISMAPEIWQACLETGLMLGIGLCAALLLGGPLGIVLFLTQPGQLWANRALHGVLGWSVNLVRSFPFIILLLRSRSNKPQSIASLSGSPWPPILCCSH